MRSSSEYITDPAHFSRRILARIYFQLSRLGGGGSLNLSTDEKPGTQWFEKSRNMEQESFIICWGALPWFLIYFFECFEFFLTIQPTVYVCGIDVG
jgi:hypothetical protein